MSSSLAPGVVLVLGGRSEIGIEVARRLAPGRTVVLAARNSATLGPHGDELARDEIARAGATSVQTVEFDADDLAAHEPLLMRVDTEFGPIGIVVLAFGILGDQQRAERDAAHAVAVIHTDFVAQVNALTHVTNYFRTRGDGQVVVFGSVAGVRVRRANYVYGSAKAGLDGFAMGLRDALHSSGIHLLLVRPGFVIGRMTDGMTPAPLHSTPSQVADAVMRGLRRRTGPVWVPAALRPVFFLLRLVPQPIWRRMPR